MPTLTELTSALIAAFEGPEKLTAYRDTGGVWTIGRGHTLGVKQGMTCTHDQVVAWFAEDQAPLFALVASASTAPVPMLAAAALVSFGYNCGSHALSNVLTGADTIDNPRHATDRQGVTQPGLVSRRNLERLLLAVATR
jgi:GH24 family phage-related lysozyme (muramidase)